MGLVELNVIIVFVDVLIIVCEFGVVVEGNVMLIGFDIVENCDIVVCYVWFVDVMVLSVSVFCYDV